MHSLTDKRDTIVERVSEGHAEHAPEHRCRHHRAPDSGSSRRLGIVLVLITIYMIAEALGGWYTNSLALLSDAGHMLTDVAAIGLSMLAIWFGARPAPVRKTYGYYRLEILAAFVNGMALVAMSGLIIYEAYSRAMDPPVVASGPMMLVAAGGLVVSIVGVSILHARPGGGAGSLNEYGAFLHIIGDLLGSVGTLVAGALMWAYGWYLADPIASAFIALLIIVSSYELIAEAVNVLLEGTPSHINIAAVKESILGIDGVVDVHDLHVWSITSGKDALSAHVVCACDDYSKAFVEAIRHQLVHRFGISHLTIQLETPDFEEDEIHF
jgi:cobalt-zinc-cadmium efflux system protein